jgi:hypothetical protein
MKKLDKSINKEYPPVVIYLEDLEEIERVLKDNAKDFVITYGNFQYDSINELVGAVGAIKILEVELKARNPYTTIDLHKTWTRVYVSASETTAVGVFYQIEAIILRCRRRFPWIYKSFFLFFGSIPLALLTNLSVRLGVQIKYLFPLYLIFIIWSIWGGCDLPPFVTPRPTKLIPVPPGTGLDSVG